jgi:hypothetical protein
VPPSSYAAGNDHHPEYRRPSRSNHAAEGRRVFLLQASGGVWAVFQWFIRPRCVATTSSRAYEMKMSATLPPDENKLA